MKENPTSIYDITKSFEENATYGPFWTQLLPEIFKPKDKISFMGKPLNSRFGVAACPLTTNSRYVELMANLGYDLITYKSVRSIEWHGNPAPHWRYVDHNGSLTKTSQSETVVGSVSPFKGQSPTMANSFGIHSLKPEYWQADVAQALKVLHPGQQMIVSLMFTPRQDITLVDDARHVAELAAETPADIFEVNLSHPNTAGGAMMIYEDLDLAVEVITAMRKALKNKKLLAKVGYFNDPAVLKGFMEKTTYLLDGIVSMNTFAMNVSDERGNELFPGRPKAGVSGEALRKLAMNQMKSCMTFKEKLGLDHWSVIAVGGVIKPEHIDDYLELGVDAVQAAVGAWADPYLASTYKQRKG